jgi:hypothetical protein
VIKANEPMRITNTILQQFDKANNPLMWVSSISLMRCGDYESQHNGTGLWASVGNCGEALSEKMTTCATQEL